MFNTYRSKDGFTIIGQRPMFDDVAYEVLGATIKAKLFEVFGHYPILGVSEHWEYVDEDIDEPVVLRDYQAIFDTEKLDLVGYGVSYVQFLFEKIIIERMKNPTSDCLNTAASKKYCFSDTEDWWTAMQIESLPAGRERFDVIVELG